MPGDPARTPIIESATTRQRREQHSCPHRCSAHRPSTRAHSAGDRTCLRFGVGHRAVSLIVKSLHSIENRRAFGFTKHCHAHSPCLPLQISLAAAWAVAKAAKGAALVSGGAVWVSVEGMTVAADLEEGEVGGCERRAVVAPSPRKLHSVFNAGLGLAYGPMS